jgi:signal transduction histidine kinase
MIDSAPDVDSGITHARNALDVEAVSVLDRDAQVVESTSETLVGLTLSNALLDFGAYSGRFAALAAPTTEPISIDGVVEWPVGSVLYQVLSPLDDGNSILLHYDVSQLLSRRAQPGTVEPETIELLSLAGVFGLLAIAVFIGHSRATRRHREIEVESALIRQHSIELEAANIELEDARHSAERALNLAEEKMRIRSEFVLMINHELRTPLTTVVTGAELVRSGELSDAEVPQVLEAMITDGRRLQDMIDQILAVARIENRGLSYETTEVPLEDVCEAVNATFRRSERRGVDPTAARTDVATLALVVASLADNARTHGAGRVRVYCTTHAVIDPMIEVGRRPTLPVFLYVEDDGPGIDPEFLPRAFEKFEKHSFSPGTGLGLYMARLMVEALDGSIAVQTSPSGTTFQIAIPGSVSKRVPEWV